MQIRKMQVLFIILSLILCYCYCDINNGSKRVRKSPDTINIHTLELNKKIERMRKIVNLISEVTDANSFKLFQTKVNNEFYGAYANHEVLLAAHYLKRRVDAIKRSNQLNPLEYEEFNRIITKYITACRNTVTRQMIDYATNEADYTFFLLHAADINDMQKLQILRINVDKYLAQPRHYSKIYRMSDIVTEQIELRRSLTTSDPIDEWNDDFFVEAEAIRDNIEAKADTAYDKYVDAMEKIKIGESDMITNIKDLHSLTIFRNWIKTQVHLTDTELLSYAVDLENQVKKLPPSLDFQQLKAETMSLLDYIKRKTASYNNAPGTSANVPMEMKLTINSADNIEFGDVITVKNIVDMKTLNMFKTAVKDNKDQTCRRLLETADNMEGHIAELLQSQSMTSELKKMQSGINDFVQYLRNKARLTLIPAPIEPAKRKVVQKKSKTNLNTYQARDQPGTSSSNVETHDSSNTLKFHITTGVVKSSKNIVNPIMETVQVSDVVPHYPVESPEVVDKVSRVQKKSPEFIESINQEDRSRILRILIDNIESEDEISRLNIMLKHMTVENGHNELITSLMYETDSHIKKITDRERKSLFVKVQKLLTAYSDSDTLLSNPLNELKSDDTRKIFKTIVSKIENIDDLNRLKYVVDHILIQRMNDATRTLIAADLNDRLQKLSKVQRDDLYEDGVKLHNRLDSTVETFKTIAKVFTDERDIIRLRDLSVIMDASMREQVAIDLDKRIKQMAPTAASSNELIEEAVKLSNNLRDDTLFMKRRGLGRKQGKKYDPIRCLTTKRTKRSERRMANCYYSWTDINHFNDATEKNAINKIRVNSEKFLKTLTIEEFRDVKKAKQLMKTVRSLISNTDNSEIITGNYKILLKDVLKEKSLKAFRRKQEFTNVLIDLSKQSSDNKLATLFIASKFMATSVAAIVPIIHGVYVTINTCMEKSNSINENCIIGSAALTISVLTIGASLAAPRFLPWAVEEAIHTSLAILPRKTTNLIQFGVKSLVTTGTMATLHMLVVLQLGFDIYNIILMSQMISTCSQQGNECTIKDKLSYVISLTFSCISIAVTAGIMLSGVGFVTAICIGFTMLLIESILLGINAVMYYSKNYQTTFGENTRIFFHQIGFQNPPIDVEALVHRTDWICNLQQILTDLLNNNENVVAYGIGIGKFEGYKVVPSIGSIDMKYFNESYSKNLSRVQPITTDNNILLCLPRVNTKAAYYDYAINIPSAVFKCDNTFVMANKKRWNDKSSETSHIVYDLALINDGYIVGSDILNNIFLIHNGTADLHINGGAGNITNAFIIQNHFFNGNITLEQARSNIIDLSNIDVPILRILWTDQFFKKLLCIGINENNIFYITSNVVKPNLHIIGRSNQVDLFDCNNSTNNTNSSNEQSVSVDTRGGNSSSNMDIVKNCEVSIVRPYTRIIAHDQPNRTFTAQLWLEYNTSPTSGTAYASIEPQQSTFVLVFGYRPLFASFSGVEYNPKTKNLLWKVRYDYTMTLILSIVSYQSGVLPKQSSTIIDEVEINPVNCIFIDGYFGNTVTPIINSATDDNGTLLIREFNVFANINSNHMHDVLEKFEDMHSIQSDDLYIVTQFKYPPTNETFIIGSMKNDRFLIDNHTTFVAGRNGADIYVYTNESASCLQICLETTDNTMDILLILDEACNDLQAMIGSNETSCSNNSIYDVILICHNNNTRSKPNYIMLRNYFTQAPYQHLQIIWHNNMYIIVPPDWLYKYNSATISYTLRLALLISFDGLSQSGVLTLTSDDTYVAFNITNEDINPLVAYKGESNDLILARKFFHYDNFLYIIFHDFFIDNTTKVAAKWSRTMIFIINDTISSELIEPKILSTREITKLLVNSVVTKDIIKEYVIKIPNDNDTKNHTTVIDHNSDISMERVGYKYGIIVFIGAEPKDVELSWFGNDTLTLCVNGTCVFVENWCNYIKRINQIEFYISWNPRPITINNISQIGCPLIASDKSITELKENLEKAQLQLKLRNNEDDHSYLLQCIGSIFADIVTRNFTYKLFGFNSLIEQRQFINENCRELFTVLNVTNNSLVDMKKLVRNNIAIYLMNDKLTTEDIVYVERVRHIFTSLNHHTWQSLITCLYDYYSRGTNNIDIDSLTVCLRKLIV